MPRTSDRPHSEDIEFLSKMISYLWPLSWHFDEVEYVVDDEEAPAALIFYASDTRDVREFRINHGFFWLTPGRHKLSDLLFHGEE